MSTLTSLSALAGLAAASVAGAGVSFTTLGANIFATDVSADGSVVVGDNNVTGQYFIWTQDGGIVDIGGAVAGNGVGGQARISADGSRVSGTELNDSTGLFEMSRYNVASGQWTNLGGLSGFSDSETSSGWGMSRDGSHIVGLGFVDDSAGTAGRGRAIQWIEGSGLTNLGTTTTRSSRANDVSDDGSVVVGWQDADNGNRQAAVWNNGVQTVLTTDTGLFAGEATGVSADGQWATGIFSNGTGRQAWRWSEDTGVEMLGTLFPGAFPPTTGLATAISADGSTILGTDRGFGPPFGGEGFIWTEATGMVNFDDFLLSHGVDMSDTFDFAVPFAMSDDGLTFVGIGRTEGSFAGVGFVVTIPAPGAVSLFGIAGALAARRRR